MKTFLKKILKKHCFSPKDKNLINVLCSTSTEIVYYELQTIARLSGNKERKHCFENKISGLKSRVLKLSFLSL